MHCEGVRAILTGVTAGIDYSTLLRFLRSASRFPFAATDRSFSLIAAGVGATFQRG